MSPNLSKGGDLRKEENIGISLTREARYLSSTNWGKLGSSRTLISGNPKRSSKPVRCSVDIANPYASVDLMNIDVQGTIASHVPLYNGILDYWNKSLHKDKMGMDAPNCFNLTFCLERNYARVALLVGSAHPSKRKWVDEEISSPSLFKAKKQKIVKPFKTDFRGRTLRVQNKRGRDSYVDIAESEYEGSNLNKRVKVDSVMSPNIQEELEMPHINFPSPLQSTPSRFLDSMTSIRNGLDSLMVVEDLHCISKSYFASLVFGFFLRGVKDDDFIHVYSLLSVEEYSQAPKNTSSIFMDDTLLQQFLYTENLRPQLYLAEREVQNSTYWDWKVIFGTFPDFGPDISIEQLQVNRLLELIRNIYGLEWQLEFMERAIARGIPFDPGLERNSKKIVQMRVITWVQGAWTVCLLIYSLKLKEAPHHHRFSKKPKRIWKNSSFVGAWIHWLFAWVILYYISFDRSNTLKLGNFVRSWNRVWDSHDFVIVMLVCPYRSKLLTRSIEDLYKIESPHHPFNTFGTLHTLQANEFSNHVVEYACAMCISNCLNKLLVVVGGLSKLSTKTFVFSRSMIDNLKKCWISFDTDHEIYVLVCSCHLRIFIRFLPLFFDYHSNFLMQLNNTYAQAVITHELAIRVSNLMSIWVRRKLQAFTDAIFICFIRLSLFFVMFNVYFDISPSIGALVAIMALVEL